MHNVQACIAPVTHRCNMHSSPSSAVSSRTCREYGPSSLHVLVHVCMHACMHATPWSLRLQQVSGKA